MAKIVDFRKTVYELCKTDPELVQVMKEIGFEQITDPVSLNTVGRVMTIPKGAVMKGKNLDTIKAEFANRGYQVVE